MPPPNTSTPLSGSLRIFQIAGISVFVHWSWLLVAIFQVQYRADRFGSQLWNVIEFLSLFAIVLLHEFGHALACRQVGGKAERIVLWPLGGVAFVNPPPRPGAVLWSIAAGPLVNLVLVPITLGATMLAASQGLSDTNPNAANFLVDIFYINLLLLIFNLLPVYPLDGGQILQSLLWFVIGRAKSLMVVSVIGLVVAVVVILAAFILPGFTSNYWWYMIMAIFVGYRSFVGFQQARVLAKMAAIPHHAQALCPNCHARPPAGDYWICDRCRNRFDLFANGGVCPNCKSMFPSVPCPDCQRTSAIHDWYRTGRRA
jgi:Zn-dependent protease